MYKWIFLFVVLCISVNGYAKNNNDVPMFKRIFSTWADAFNNRKLSQSCALFSKSVVADYQGVPRKNYATICHGFKKIFEDKNHQYQYQFKFHDIYRSGDLATIRITWYLHTYKGGKLISTTRDEGMDILTLENGQWKIVNYIGYPVKNT